MACNKKCWRLGAYLGVAGLLLTVQAWAGEGFVLELDGSASRPWLRPGVKRLGGLGFEVAAEGWPAIMQRGFLDVVHPHEGSVFLAKNWPIELGAVRLGGGSAVARLEKSDWVSAEFFSTLGDRQLRFWVSRLTPALLCQTQANAMELFAGEKRVYTTSAEGAVTGRGTSGVVPAYVAFAAGGKVAVKAIDSEISLEEMSESWLLAWYGQRAICRRLAVPNVIQDGYYPDYTKQLQEKWLIAADLPVLVVFQKKPKSLEPAGDCLRVSFGEGGTGHVSLSPLLGFYHPPVTQTAGWKARLPDDVAGRCRTWARRLKSYPLTCTVWRSVREDGAAVTVREQFTYLDLPDAWGTPVERLAPLPPVLVLCRQYGFPVEISGQPAPEAIVTHSGPYTGILGADSVEYTIRGLNRYVDEEVCSPEPSTEEARRMARELQDEISKMTEAGVLSPGFSYSHQRYFYYANPGEDILALGEAMPYLTDEGRKAAFSYAQAIIAKVNPLKTARRNTFGDARREYFKLLSPEYHKDISGHDSLSPIEYVTQEERSNNLYALWCLARQSGQWDFVRELWPDFKAAALADKNLADWATSGFFKRLPPHSLRSNSGGVDAVNGEFGRWVGLARMARRLQDRASEDTAFYWLSRAALNRLAQGKLVQYLYDEKIQTIEERPDWMIEWARCSGTIYMWTTHWTGAEDDVRQVIHWDEFGPIVSHTLGDGWNPIMPLFLDMSPECARFLADFLVKECRRYVERVERVSPAWFVTQGEPVLSREMNQDRLFNPYGIFLGKCYVLATEGSRMMPYQDMPAFRVGDDFHIRKLVANLRSFGGLKWQKTQP